LQIADLLQIADRGSQDYRSIVIADIHQSTICNPPNKLRNLQSSISNS